MKKTYITPSTRVVLVEDENIIASSPGVSGYFSDPTEDNLVRENFLDIDIGDMGDEVTGEGWW
ncbi:MAG: hypothetical protein MJZ35_02255 [Bacteroidaceae bacterium]|nr:hypothetical protein [Bacteroidaceae bacterium]